MSLTPEARKEVLDYFFKEPNAKAVVEDGLDSNIQDVRDFLYEIYEHLTQTLFPPVVEVPTMGRGATTADLERMRLERESHTPPGLKQISRIDVSES